MERVKEGRVGRREREGGWVEEMEGDREEGGSKEGGRKEGRRK